MHACTAHFGRCLGTAILLLVGSLAPAASVRGADAVQAVRPNLLFILIDDQRHDSLGITGHPFVKTPQIDRIGREGAVFRSAFVTTPLCSPSRATFLTGQFARTHGILDNRDRGPRSHELVTFPRLLRDAGYETAYVGKWHMGVDDRARPGFDRWVSFRGQGAYVNPRFNVDGVQTPREGYVTDLLTDYAVDFIRQPHAKPYALCLSHKAVHGPFTPADRHKDLYADQPIVRSPNARDTLEGKPVLQRQAGNLPPIGPGTGSGDGLIRSQLRGLAAIDEGVGRILEALKETGQLDRTMIVYTSDNGYFWGEHGLGDKRAAYEESLRVPLLIRYPPLLRAGTVREQMVQNLDIAPTFLELGRAPIPREMEGRSLVPLFRDASAPWRKAALFEYFAEPQFARIPAWTAVRTERWKYIRYPELEGMDELYDLSADPYEMKNRIADSAIAATLAELKRELEALSKRAP